MNRRLFARPVLVAAICVTLGALAGIAGSAASPRHHGSSDRSGHPGGPPGPPPFVGHRGPMGGPPVHAEAVVLNKAGDGFVTLTTDSGKVKSVSGSDLTLTEGVGDVTYKDVTLTIPSGATVRRNFADAQLGDLKAGDFVHVASSSEGTEVFAVDPAARPPRRWGDDRHDGPDHGDRGW